MNPCPRELGEAGRRRRLLEVLFLQALGLPGDDAAAAVEQVEPQLSPEAIDRICIFLGHPPRCPHDRAIPQGNCCRTLASGPGGIVQPVSPLTEAAVGDLCEIVLIRPRSHARLDRLGSYGVAPGARIRLHQKRPAYVIQIGETDLALDADVAGDIFVREVEGTGAPREGG